LDAPRLRKGGPKTKWGTEEQLRTSKTTARSNNRHTGEVIAKRIHGSRGDPAADSRGGLIDMPRARTLSRIQEGDGDCAPFFRTFEGRRKAFRSRQRTRKATIEKSKPARHLGRKSQRRTVRDQIWRRKPKKKVH